MLLDNKVRTFPCPQCGAILTTGAGSCDACGAPIGAAVAEAAAERREQILKSNGDANSLVLSARMFLFAFALSFAPVVSMIGVAAVAALLVQVPYLAFRWHRRYGKLTYPEPELAEARGWWKQALGLWALALLATPVWAMFRFGVGFARL